MNVTTERKDLLLTLRFPTEVIISIDIPPNELKRLLLLFQDAVPEKFTELLIRGFGLESE